MSELSSNDFAMEWRLKKLSPELHNRFKDAVFSLQHILSNYKLIFPEYTDHTELHSLTVVDFCNSLIGAQLERLNADEVYALLMGCYFHDTGMGVSEKDFRQFSEQIDFGDYFETHSRDDLAAVVRSFHNEFAGCFVRKYAEFFEIPSDAHLRAVIQISRGHRKTQLKNEDEYPIALEVPGGNTICLPYLAALIRLADEIDVAASRNSVSIQDLESFEDAHQVFEHRKHMAVKELQISEKAFTMIVDTDDAELLKAIETLAGKMQKTLDDCRDAVIGRTPYVITQEKVVLQRV